MNPAPILSGRWFRLVARLLIAPLLALSLGTVNAQDAAEQGEAEVPTRSPEELEKLAAPIALYPDALVALILPAATVPTDVTLAARFLAGQNDPASAATQPWDDSVKALARYPEVVKWMDENLAWTRELGEAFAEQSAEVMNAIQRARAKAQAAGTLKTTPQQDVVVRDEIIYIEPARPDVIYVPHYNYDLIYGSPPWGYAGSFLTFGIGYPVGAWLTYDLDWRRRTLWRDRVWHRYDRRRPWRHDSPPLAHVGPRPTPRPWHPPANHFRPQAKPGWRDGSVIVRPRNVPEAHRKEFPRGPHTISPPNESRHWGTRPLAEVSPRMRFTRSWDGNRGNSQAATTQPNGPTAISTPAARPIVPAIQPREFRRRDRDGRIGAETRFNRWTNNPGTARAVSPPRMAPAANPPSLRQDSPHRSRTPSAERSSGDRERRNTARKQR